MTKCLNCGCYLNSGICSNCQEELYIFENQFDDLPESISDDFVEKIKEQRATLKKGDGK